MDDLARGWRLLLIAACACSPAKGEPVGVSNGGGGARHDEVADAATTATTLAGLPRDFRTRFRAVARGLASEHGGLRADVYDDEDARWAEDLFAGDAGVGVYLLEKRDGGVRFAVADPRGAAVADDDADGGPSLEACARCHAGRVFPVVP